MTLQEIADLIGAPLPPNAPALQTPIARGASLELAGPGDIVFFGSPQITGAGIYLGENRFVQAAPTFGVAYSQLNDPQFSQNYRTARRILR